MRRKPVDIVLEPAKGIFERVDTRAEGVVFGSGDVFLSTEGALVSIEFCTM
jgi:hypothetical protein